MFASVARDLHLSMVAQNLAALSGLPGTIVRPALYAATASYWQTFALIEATAQLEAALGGQDSTHPIVERFWDEVQREAADHPSLCCSRDAIQPRQPDGRVGLRDCITGESLVSQHRKPPIPIPYEGGEQLIHSTEHPFCADMSCPCHEDAEAVAQVQHWLSEGLLTAEDADRIYRGQSLAQQSRQHSTAQHNIT